MDKLLNRREFLEFITNKSALIGMSPLFLSYISGCTTAPKKSIFEAVKPSLEDKLILPDELNYHIIAKWGDSLNKTGEIFGFNNDFTSFLPLDGKNNEALLWVNHESIIPEFIHRKKTKKLKRSRKEIMKELELVGGSILHIKKDNNEWQLVQNSKFNRRLSGSTKIPFSQNTQIQGSPIAMGTLANCAGGQTPWKTFLTCEENYDDFYGEAIIVNGKRTVIPDKKFSWSKHISNPPEHYGWVVEVNPFTGQAKKQVLLGRAPHEGATVATCKNGVAVVYMGEDRPGGYIYKFVSTGNHLDDGKLYAADTIMGRWLALDIKLSPKLSNHFKNQLEVLTYAHQSAEIVGATPQDRPEDIEINPNNNEVIISLTNNIKNGNFYGSLFKIKENGDFDSLTFASQQWMSGGPQKGFACPDNLCFDKKGNLWVTVDISEKDIGKNEYSSFGNNGLFYIPMSGDQAGIPIQIASAPVDAELTGPSFSSDYQTLFLSVQHPGASSTKSLKKLSSHWPDGKDEIPKSAVVAIQGQLLNRLMN
jgi:uncharacterized protein